MNVQIEESWKAHLQQEFEKDYFRTLTEFVRNEYSQYAIYPPGKLIFNAFNLCPFDKVKVVIIGQDPYHGPATVLNNVETYANVPKIILQGVRKLFFNFFVRIPCTIEKYVYLCTRNQK